MEILNMKYSTGAKVYGIKTINMAVDQMKLFQRHQETTKSRM